jgi:O-antigen/teichoic acid export membrane protein
VQLSVAALRPVLLISALPITVPGARLSFFCVHLRLLRPLLSVSKWAFANSICANLLELVIWTILGAFGSMQAAAMFGLANKLPKQLWNAIDRGAGVFLPMMSTAAAERRDVKLRQTYVLVQKLVFGAVLPFVLLGSVFAWPILDLWAGEQYRGATTVLQWLLLATVGHAIAYPSWELVYACATHKKVVGLSITLLVASSVCALIMVPRYGAIGLAIAIAIPNLLINLGWMTWIACERLKLSKQVLLKEMLAGLSRPSLVLGGGVLLLVCVQPFLSNHWRFVGAVVCGCAYLVAWGKLAILPLYRNRMVEQSNTAISGG